MNSRLGVSVLFILTAALVVASQGTGLARQVKVLRTSWAEKISEARALPVQFHSSSARNQARRARPTSSDAQTLALNFPQVTHCLSSNGRHLQRMVLSLIGSDH